MLGRLAAGLDSVGGEGGFLDVKDNEMPLANHYKLPRLRQVLSCLRIVHITSSKCSCSGPKNAAFKQNHLLEGNSGTAPFDRISGHDSNAGATQSARVVYEREGVCNVMN